MTSKTEIDSRFLVRNCLTATTLQQFQLGARRRRSCSKKLMRAAAAAVRPRSAANLQIIYNFYARMCTRAPQCLAAEGTIRERVHCLSLAQLLFASETDKTFFFSRKFVRLRVPLDRIRLALQARTTTLHRQHLLLLGLLLQLVLCFELIDSE